MTGMAATLIVDRDGRVTAITATLRLRR